MQTIDAKIKALAAKYNMEGSKVSRESPCWCTRSQCVPSAQPGPAQPESKVTLRPEDLADLQEMLKPAPVAASAAGAKLHPRPPFLSPLFMSSMGGLDVLLQAQRVPVHPPLLPLRSSLRRPRRARCWPSSTFRLSARRTSRVRFAVCSLAVFFSVCMACV